MMPPENFTSIFNHYKKRTVVRDLSFSLVLTVSVVIALVGFTFYYTSALQIEQRLENEGSDLVEKLAAALGVLLWNMDLRAIEQIGQFYLHTSEVALLRISDESDQVVFEGAVVNRNNLLKKQMVIKYRNRKVGHVEIAIARTSIYEAKDNILQLTFLTTMLVILTIIVVNQMLLKRLLIRPLARLMHGIDCIAGGDYEFNLPRAAQADIDMISERVNAMANQIGERDSRLRKAITDLEIHVDELSRAREALFKSEEKYRSIFENAVEGIFQSTPDGRFLSVSPSHAEMLGYNSPEELIALTADIADRCYADKKDRERLLKTLSENGAVTGFETRMRRKDGRIIWCVISARAAKNDSGRLIYFEGFSMDITTQKEMADEKKRLEEQLRQSQKMEAIGTLSGGIAHDFNNILQGILGYIQLMMVTKTETDRDYRYLLEMDKAATRAADLVRRLLIFSRKMKIKLKTISLNTIVIETIKLLERTLPKMISIETTLEEGLPKIHGDPIQMEQVIINLANNAMDAMKDSGILRIETERLTLDEADKNKYLDLIPGEYVILTVSDTGHGIDKETIEHIFEPFFTTKEIGKGTGLGLATVYGIVKSHNGYINCYSGIGEGATFKIFLPEKQNDNTIAEKKKTDKESFPRGGETILLIDDEEFILSIAEDILHNLGYQTIKAKSGEDGLLIYSENKDILDLVILDLGMPGMGGENCLKELLEINPRMKVIVASGYAAHKIAQNPHEFGASAFLNKPYNLKDLAETVRSVLDG